MAVDVDEQVDRLAALCSAHWQEVGIGFLQTVS